LTNWTDDCVWTKQFTDEKLTTGVYICTRCNHPTYLDGIFEIQSPEPKRGRNIRNLPDDVSSLYDECRKAMSIGAHTVAILGFRKLLMHVAVANGAEENKSFAYYVQFLDENGYMPPKGKHWVDQIRKRGNEANHEILIMKSKDSKLILRFIEALLLFNYELSEDAIKQVTLEDQP
jgi:Domain of unknown function (DUF4145)